MVEHRTEDAGVAGSSPALTAIWTHQKSDIGHCGGDGKAER